MSDYDEILKMAFLLCESLREANSNDAYLKMYGEDDYVYMIINGQFDMYKVAEILVEKLKSTE